jgi:hypothetical protein
MKWMSALIALALMLALAAAACAADEVVQPTPPAPPAQPTQAIVQTQTVAPPPPPPEPVVRDSVNVNTDWREYVDNMFTPQGAYFPEVNESDYLGRPGDQGNWRDYYLADKPYVPGVGWPRRVPYVEVSLPPIYQPPYRPVYYYPVYYYAPPPPPPPVIIIINNNVY